VQFPQLQTWAPSDPVTFTCTLGGVTSSLTNTVTLSAIGIPDGLTHTASASAQVTVNTPPPLTSPPLRAASSPRKNTSSAPSPKALVPTLTVVAVTPVDLASKHPTLALTVKVSKKGRFDISLRTKKGKTVAAWSLVLKPGTHKLVLLVPRKARHRGQDTLRIAESGTSKPITRPVTLRG
jgi:hypothetical protein